VLELRAPSRDSRESGRSVGKDGDSSGSGGGTGGGGGNGGGSNGGGGAGAGGTVDGDGTRTAALQRREVTLVSPGVAGVYLNGLQCTRLPQQVPSNEAAGGPSTGTATGDATAAGVGADSPPPQDCALAQWPLDEQGSFVPPPGLRSTAGRDGSADGRTAGGSEAQLVAALRWLACTSHYCCGLQVVQPGAGTSSSDVGRSSGTSEDLSPAVVGMDGPGSGGADATQVGDGSMATNNGSAGDNSVAAAALRGDGAGGADTQEAFGGNTQPASQSRESAAAAGVRSTAGDGTGSGASSNLVGALAGALGGTAAVGLLAGLLVWRRGVTLRRHARRRAGQLAGLTKMLSATPQHHLTAAALARAGSGASSGASATSQPGAC
jgi:hypothetical protein